MRWGYSRLGEGLNADKGTLLMLAQNPIWKPGANVGSVSVTYKIWNNRSPYHGQICVKNTELLISFPGADHYAYV